jgi:hypothetical protein
LKFCFPTGLREHKFFEKIALIKCSITKNNNKTQNRDKRRSEFVDNVPFLQECRILVAVVFYFFSFSFSSFLLEERMEVQNRRPKVETLCQSNQH